MRFSILSTSIATALVGAMGALAAADFHIAYYKAPNNVLAFTGNIIVPPRLPSGGIPYLWPGLQPADNKAVLQPVLDGRNLHWYFGNALVGTPSGPYGGGVGCGVNDVLGFNMTNVDGLGNWFISSSNGDAVASYTYNINLQLPNVIFAAELYPGTAWDFGDVVFTDVEIKVAGTDASWCVDNPGYQKVNRTLTGVSSSVADNVVSCKIESLTLSPP